MDKSKFTWTAKNTEGSVGYEGENDRYIGCVELVGVDLHGNPMWFASLFDKESSRPIPISEFGLPFTSAESAQKAILRVINKQRGAK